jgi:hypothetical protein
MRAMMAICGNARVMTGRIRLRGAPPAQPATGRRARARPNTICSTGAITKVGIDGAERAAHDDGETEREPTDPHRDGQTVGKELSNAEVAHDEGGAEVALHDGHEIAQVLLKERAVEAVDLLQVLHDLGLERALQVEGAARREPDQEERNRDDDE